MLSLALEPTSKTNQILILSNFTITFSSNDQFVSKSKNILKASCFTEDFFYMNLLSSWKFIPRIFTGSLKYLQNSQIISEVNLTSLSEPYSARSYFNVQLFYLGLLSRETAFHNTEGKWKKLLFPTTTSTFPWKFRNLFAVMLLRCLPQLSTAVRVISGLFLSKINQLLNHHLNEI